ncbi:MAG: PPK2 family polyphosphate kinase, partial [Acidimicrobiales bacterium]
MTAAGHLHRIEPGSKVDLSGLDTGDVSAAPGDKEETELATEPLVRRLADLQAMLWAGGAERLLVVLQGIDTAGKGGTVEHVLGAVNPAGLRVTSFKAPTSSELARDYLWRVHANVPIKGEIGVFDRSHYEDVLVVRVEGLVPEAQWMRRYDHINSFEQLLVDEGTTVIKLFLNISRHEQRERLLARLAEPDKRWKFKRDDLEVRAKWEDYQAAFTAMLERTSTEHAPWHVIPADKKWYRNWAVATILVEALERLHLTWPEPEEDLS